MTSPEKPATIHSAGGVVDQNNSQITPKYSNPEYKRRDLNSNYNLNHKLIGNSALDKDARPTNNTSQHSHGESEGDPGSANASVPPSDSQMTQMMPMTPPRMMT
jgi:hypothetical protein